MKQNLVRIFWTFLPMLTAGQTAELSGTVMDSTSEEGIPMASIELIKNDSIILTTKTDIDGYFKIDDFNEGLDRLKIGAIGYHVLEVSKLNLRNDSIILKLEHIPILFEPFEINYGEGHILIEDSLGNAFCVDGSKNKVDAAGLRQGAWVKYFMDYSDTLSVYRIGQKLWEGEYQNDLKQGAWIFYLPNGEIKRVEYYEKGQLIRTKN